VGNPVCPSVVEYQKHWRTELLQDANPVPIPQNAWRKYYPIESESLFSDEWFGDRRVLIADLKKLAESGVPNRVLFVAAMMWGRGPKNGRLMPKFEKVTTHKSFEETLRKTRELVMEGKPIEAYLAWLDSGVKGIGEAFFTKWFFVCGLDSQRQGLQSLVLDKRVWKSLAAIGWSSQRQTGTKYRKDPAGAYGAYLEAMSYWASELSDESVTVSPLQVEQFFFRKSGEKLL
jgi:hypothetical protein